MKFTTLFLTPLLLSTACGAEPGTEGAAESAHTAKMEIFVMAQCPYGVQVEQALVPVKEKLGPNFELSIDYIGQGTAGSLSSMHGPNEVTGDIAQVCAQKQIGKNLLDFVACQDENPKSVHTNWKDCGEQLGLDTAALETCITGTEGQELLAASFARADARGATGSPTIYLDGQEYQGGRKSNDFLRAVCATYGDDAPTACSEIPAPPKVAAIFLGDSRCKECDLHPLEPRLKGELAGLEVTYMDYTATDGRELYTKLHEAEPDLRLPAVLLSPDVEKDADGFTSLKRYLRPVAEYQELRVGGSWDPTAEICDNSGDDDGDGLVDCADDGCNGSMLCREAIPGKLDLFVMSHCPYGAKALVATADVVGAFGDDIDVDVHFIGSDRGGTLSSMHGQTEVDEDIREACAQEKYPKKHQFLDYMACISRDYKTVDWKDCAKEAKMDTAVIEKCVAGEGPDLVRKSFASAAELGISSSPTFLVNNKRTFNAIEAPALQKEYCTDNPSLAGCGATVESSATGGPVAPGECGG